jgi:AraC family transcriptional regulator
MRSIDLIRAALEKKRAEGQPGKATAQVLAAGRGWRVSDVVCTSGPSDRVFEEQRTHFSVAFVLAGTFTYRASRERVALVPGAMLLGNAGECFECAHDHGEGDRCLAFHFEPDFFESIRSEVATGTKRRSFGQDRLPPSPSSMRICAAAELFASSPETADVEELALEAAATAIAAGSAEGIRLLEPGPDQIRRTSEAIRFISANLDHPLSLEALARSARMSRFGFVRCFKRIAGSTPHAYIRAKRISEAAVRLRTSRQSIADVALEVGFSDLSTFNAAFKAMMGRTPSAWRSTAHPRQRRPAALFPSA